MTLPDPPVPAGPLDGLLRASGGQAIQDFVAAVLVQKQVNPADPVEVSLGTAAAVNLWLISTGNLGAVRAVLEAERHGVPLETACEQYLSRRSSRVGVVNRASLLQEAKRLFRQLWREQQAKIVDAAAVVPPPVHGGHRALPLPCRPPLRAV